MHISSVFGGDAGTSPGRPSFARIGTGKCKGGIFGHHSSSSVYVFAPPLFAALSTLPLARGLPSSFGSAVSFIYGKFSRDVNTLAAGIPFSLDSGPVPPGAL